MNVLAKAAALSAAWSRVTGANPPTRLAVLYPLAQADLETQDGDAWGGDKGPHDWGATDYRAPNAAELAAISTGDLKTGYWLHADGTTGPDRRTGDVAQLHLDTHPGAGTYSMWFAAFDDDTAGAAYYLKIVLRMVGGLLSDPTATLEQYATDLYLHGYYEGRHAGARPVGHRSAPLTAPEQANVADYVAGCNRCLASLVPALAGWVVPGGATGDLVAGDDGVTSDPAASASDTDPPSPGGPGWENNEDLPPTEPDPDKTPTPEPS